MRDSIAHELRPVGLRASPETQPGGATRMIGTCDVPSFPVHSRRHETASSNSKTPRSRPGCLDGTAVLLAFSHQPIEESVRPRPTPFSGSRSVPDGGLRHSVTPPAAPPRSRARPAESAMRFAISGVTPFDIAEPTALQNGRSDLLNEVQGKRARGRPFRPRPPYGTQIRHHPLEERLPVGAVRIATARAQRTLCCACR